MLASHVSLLRRSLLVQGRMISSARLTIETKNTGSSSKFKKEELSFGKTMTDHMLTVEFKDGQWGDPQIKPYQMLEFSPAASGLHYGLQCFEGMKAYQSLKDDDSSIRLFRPDKNMKRLSNSMARLQMPGSDFDPKELINCISQLVRLDKDWIPSGMGYSLYLRPTVVATHSFLGLAPPESILLYVIMSPVGSYYKVGSVEPVRLTADTPFVRAWPGGTGNHKVGGNYAGTMKAQVEATGYDQVLWLYNDEATEVGSMNVFFVFQKKDGSGVELVTPPLDRGDILPGVTRDSILQLAKGYDGVDVVERFPTMTEISQAVAEGRLVEAFGAGTAAVVTPISCIKHKGVDIEIPLGPMTGKVMNAITSIQYGIEEGPEGWSVKI